MNLEVISMAGSPNIIQFPLVLAEIKLNLVHFWQKLTAGETCQVLLPIGLKPIIYIRKKVAKWPQSFLLKSIC